MQFPESFNKFIRILFILCLCQYKFISKSNKYECDYKCIIYVLFFSVAQFCAIFTILWYNELRELFLEPSTVFGVSEFLRITSSAFSYQVIIVLFAINRLYQLKLLNALNEFDEKLLKSQSLQTKCVRIDNHFMCEMLLWSIYYFIILTIVDSQFAYPIYDVYDLLWYFAYSLLQIGMSFSYFFVLFCKRHIDLRFKALNTELEMVVGSIQTMPTKVKINSLFLKLSAIFQLEYALCKIKHLFKRSFGALLCFLILNDVVAFTGNVYAVVYTIMHLDKSDSQPFLIDFTLYVVPIFIRDYYFVRSVSSNNNEQVNQVKLGNVFYFIKIFEQTKFSLAVFKQFFYCPFI